MTDRRTDCGSVRALCERELLDETISEGMLHGARMDGRRSLAAEILDLLNTECRSVAHVTEPVSDFVGLMDEDAAALRGLGNIAAAKAVEHWAWRVKLLFGIAAGEHPHNAKNTEQESVSDD